MSAARASPAKPCPKTGNGKTALWSKLPALAVFGVDVLIEFRRVLHLLLRTVPLQPAHAGLLQAVGGGAAANCSRLARLSFPQHEK